MSPRPTTPYRSHGSGAIERDRFRALGENVVFEPGVLVFHPENISIGSNAYVGHYAILKGYYRNEMIIGDNTWIGQQCLFHSAGGIRIGRNVGVGSGVRILTSRHADEGREVPILFGEILTAEVVIEDDCDIGIGAIVLPGVRIGKGSIVGAGAVVNRDVEPYSVVAGVPARWIRTRA